MKTLALQSYCWIMALMCILDVSAVSLCLTIKWAAQTGPSSGPSVRGSCRPKESPMKKSTPPPLLAGCLVVPLASIMASPLSRLICSKTISLLTSQTTMGKPSRLIVCCKILPASQPVSLRYCCPPRKANTNLTILLPRLSTIDRDNNNNNKCKVTLIGANFHSRLPLVWA